MPDKSEVRQILKERRFSLTEEERKQMSEDITKRLEPLLVDAKTILFYATKVPEVDTFPAINHMLKAGKTIAVPIIEKETRTLRLSRICSTEELRTSTFSVPEPILSEKPISPKEIDTVILPLLGFDRAGRRLGFGVGYYDRFLASNPHMKKIGLAYSIQEEPIIPTDQYDIPLDIIVTEKETIFFHNSF